MNVVFGSEEAADMLKKHQELEMMHDARERVTSLVKSWPFSGHDLAIAFVRAGGQTGKNVLVRDASMWLSRHFEEAREGD
jgi:hypothetical protein